MRRDIGGAISRVKRYVQLGEHAPRFVKMPGDNGISRLHAVDLDLAARAMLQDVQKGRQPRHIFRRLGSHIAYRV